MNQLEWWWLKIFYSANSNNLSRHYFNWLICTHRWVTDCAMRQIPKMPLLCRWASSNISIHIDSMHSFACSVWVRQMPREKKKFKFRFCFSVVQWNLHLNVWLICVSGCANTHIPISEHHTETKRLSIYVNAAENFASMKIWMQNVYRISINALNIKSGTEPQNAAYVCVRAHKYENNVKKSTIP